MKTAFFDITGSDAGTLYMLDTASRTLIQTTKFTLGDTISLPMQDVPQDSKDCILSLPLRMLNFRVLNLPLTDINRIRDVLPFELDGLVLGDPQDYIIDAIMLGDENGTSRVLAVYIEKSVLAPIIDGLDSLGLEPRIATSIDLAYILRSDPPEADLARLLTGPPLEDEDTRVQQALMEALSGTLNLRRGALSYRKDAERARRSLLITSALVLLLALLIGGNFGVKTYAIKKESRQITQSIMKAYKSAFPNENIKNAKGLTYKLKAKVKELKTMESAFRGAETLEFMMALTSATPDNTTITGITLDIKSVTIKGEAESLSQIDGLKTNLEGFLSDVNISNTGRSTGGDIVFTITARRQAS